jgi:hypothetical protein
MCFYLYAPHHNIEIPYANETIKLLSDGSSEIITELLISNSFSKKLSSVNLIYPNSFLKPRKQFKEFDTIGFFENKTEELLKDNCNYHYTRDPNKEFEIAGNILTIGDKNTKRIYKGKVIDTHKNALILHDHQSDYLEFIEILTLIFGLSKKFNLFSFTFKEPIEINENRWIKLYFKPLSTSVVKLNAYNRYSSKYLYSSSLNHKVYGPVDVIHDLEEHLSAIESVSQKGFNEIIASMNEESHNQIHACQASLKDKLISKGISSAQVIINDLRIAIATGEPSIRIINPIEAVGIERFNPFSFYSEEGNAASVSYHFFTGKTYGKNDASFGLNIISETAPEILKYTIPFILFLYVFLEIALFNINPSIGIISLFVLVLLFIIKEIIR